MSGYLSRVFEYAVPCLLFWGVLAVSVTVDRSRFRNCIYLLLAAASSAPLFCVLSGSHALGTARALSILIFAVLLSVPAVLIENGVIMYRKEGRSLVRPKFRVYHDRNESAAFYKPVGDICISGICVVYELYGAFTAHSPQEGL